MDGKPRKAAGATESAVKTGVGSAMESAPARALAGAGIVCLASVLQVLFVELLSRRSYDAFLIWTGVHTAWLVRTVCLAALWNGLWIALRGRGSAGLRWGGGLLLIPALIDYYKVEFRSAHFELSDLAETGEGLRILTKVHPRPAPVAVAALAVCLLALPCFLPRKKLCQGKKGARALWAALSLALFLAGARAFFAAPVTDTFEVKELYGNVGLLRGLAETLPRDELRTPDGYGPEAVAAAAARLRGGGESARAETRPDIFFIMSESLYDLSLQPDLALTADPLAGFRALQAAHAGGEVLALGYGGGTYYSEYEVLTGYRVADTPSRLYYDRRIMREGMAALPALLARQGYRTAAIHPNRGSFYQRSRNYACMGFQERYFSDAGIPKLPVFAGGYPADRALFDYAYGRYEAMEGDAPRFLHIVTYQNHGGYDYPPARTDIQATGRTGGERLAAENFANGILEHVEALEALLARLAAQERPAVVVVWGDHAPNMRPFGVRMPEEAERQTGFYRTPLLVWSNYGASFTLPEGGVLPPYRLGAWLLGQLGLTGGDRYFSLLADTKAPDLFTVLRLVGRDGAFRRDDAAYDGVDADLRLLHYDRLLGNDYLGGAEGS